MSFLQNVVNATAACREVKTSPKFSKFLELVLLMGNYMNAGSRNEGSMGFEMNYLTKVSLCCTMNLTHHLKSCFTYSVKDTFLLDSLMCAALVRCRLLA